ncbi:MAG: molybdopterin-dependent oxidoreductase, partial [Anaerolineales bacterium]|nr:molybdopterin-dependent oxidoreductase [Anaerolineales bacterium]
MKKIKSSEITPEQIYLSRKQFLKSMGVVGVSAAVLAACGVKATEPSAIAPTANDLQPAQMPSSTMDELGDTINTFDDITNYNNFYEFTVDKEGVARLAEGYPTSPWEVAVGGLVNNPKTYSIDDLKKFEIEERIYRLRCVEAWSMVIPWMGFPLHRLLA